MALTFSFPMFCCSFDLPQVAAAMVGRPLTFIHPQDAMKNNVGLDNAIEAYKATRLTYEAAGLGKLFRIEAQSARLDHPGELSQPDSII